MRLFVSIDLPNHLTAPLADLQSAFEPADGLRLVDPEQAHITLKFLGETDSERLETLIDRLGAAVDAASVGPFEASVEGIGVFPEIEYIRVVWVGIDDGAEQMGALHEAIESAMVDMGYEPASHAFTPHVTLGRMKHAGGKSLVQRLVRDREPVLGTMHVDSISLRESTRTPDGPTYETVETFSI